MAGDWPPSFFFEFVDLESVSVHRHAKKKETKSQMSSQPDLTFRSIVIVPGRRFNVKDKGIGAILLAASSVFFLFQF